jgi:hypothetical protein
MLRELDVALAVSAAAGAAEAAGSAGRGSANR